MKLVKIDPPGSFCHYEAIFEMVSKIKVQNFIEVGCGAGDLSQKLCERGLRGLGLDFSDLAIASASKNLAPYLQNGQYQLMQADLMEMAAGERLHDLGLSMMVMEHVADDVAFIQKIAAMVKPGGYVMLGVPGRRDKWSLEDETVGHLRRYDREDLEDVLKKAGLEEVEVWSVAVPVANLLFRLGLFMVSRSSEVEKKNQSLREQTASSGVREIPFKTVFPPIFKLILNRYTLFPLFVIQRLFYRTDLGLTMLGLGRVAE